MLSFIAFIMNVLLLHLGYYNNDIGLNPGQKYFTICHWNLNSLTAHNY